VHLLGIIARAYGEAGLMAGSNAPLHGMPPVSANMPGDTTSLSAPPPDTQGYTGLQLWLHRITVLLFVFLCASAGVLLVIFPWRPEWTDNHFLFGNPGLRQFISGGFVRGVVSGLGVLDIWIGFSEAVHYHEHRRA
jgi:hypothetical protein